MRASIQQRMDFAGAIARDDQRTQAETARDEVVGLGDLAFMAEEVQVPPKTLTISIAKIAGSV